MLHHGLRRVQQGLTGFPEVATSAQTNSAGSSVSSLAVAMPSGIVSGNMLLVVLSHSSTSATWGTPAGWTALSSGQGQAIFYRIATGSESSTYTFTPSSSGTLIASAWRITGNHASAAPEVQATSSGTSTKFPDPPSLAPSWGSANTLWLAVFGCARNTGLIAPMTFPSSYTYSATSVSYSSANGIHYFCGRKLAATSEDPGTFATANNSGGYLVATIAIRPA